MMGRGVSGHKEFIIGIGKTLAFILNEMGNHLSRVM